MGASCAGPAPDARIWMPPPNSSPARCARGASSCRSGERRSGCPDSAPWWRYPDAPAPDARPVFTLSGARSFVSVPSHRMSASSTDNRPAYRPAFRLKEGGLVIVIFLLGLLLTVFGGSVQMPEIRTHAAGETERVVVEKNKFLNARNLTQLAKDTSFIAIMAVGATFVIISGGIDLSVGAVYALASVLAALVFRLYGPDGPYAIHRHNPDGTESLTAPWLAVPLGMLTCLGVATL